MTARSALLDTSVFIGVETGRLDAAALDGMDVRVSVITTGELRLGVLTAADTHARAARLRSLHLAESLSPLPVDDAVAGAWSELVASLRAMRRKAPVNESWIAAVAIANDLPLATQDRDYDVMPKLTVISL